MRWLVAVFVSAALGAACSSPPTWVVVVVDAQPATLVDAVRIRVVVSSADGSPRRDETLEISEHPLPIRIPLEPEGGDASRGWIVEVSLLDAAGGAIVRSRARGGYERGVGREAGLCLDAGCVGPVECACVSSACDACHGGACTTSVVGLGPPGSAPRCPPACAASETACGDRSDDDCDGAIDCADPDCGCPDGGALDSGALDGGGCVGSEASVSGCGNGLDDDCDGATDCADSDCPCSDAGCPGFAPESTVALCHDGLDNDCDGLTDCAEGPDCRIAEGPAGCRNGLDDDCDGMIDCEELDCAHERCGVGAGERCCGSLCVDTYTDEGNCGACGLSCDPARICVRVPDGAGGFSGAACRCGVTADCVRGALCESHDGAQLCDCQVDGDCQGGAICRHPGAARHSYCGY